jgi:nitrogen fixation protein FixH
MGVVVAVNAGMIFAALASFPGKAGSDSFDLSNQYDAVLDHAQRAAE